LTGDGELPPDSGMTQRPSHRQGIVLSTGGLIGPPGTRWERRGSLAGTPVFLGPGDEFVLEKRVRESARVFESMGANVTLRVYPGMHHF
jgi:phospholipase/carboxylesterase